MHGFLSTTSSRVIILLVVAACLAYFNPGVRADWDVEDPAKWVQLPDLAPTGLDVGGVSSSLTLADDFQCTQSGPITGIHIWGSWMTDSVDPNTTFHLSIHSDIPDLDGDGPLFSRPGDLLWSADFAPGEYPGEYTSRLYAGELVEGFYDPIEDWIYQGADTKVYQYNFTIAPVDAFSQTEGTIYWLDVHALVDESCHFGWKTSLNHWNDDAVWYNTDNPLYPIGWNELRYPMEQGHLFEGESIDLSFTLVPEPQTYGLIAGLVLIGFAGIRRFIK